MKTEQLTLRRSIHSFLRVPTTFLLTFFLLLANVFGDFPFFRLATISATILCIVRTFGDGDLPLGALAC